MGILQAMIESLQTENAKLEHESRLSNTKSETLAAELTKSDVSLQRVIRKTKISLIWPWML